MTVISNNRGSLAHYPTCCAKNYYTKIFLVITMTIVHSDFFQTSSAIVESILWLNNYNIFKTIPNINN